MPPRPHDYGGRPGMGPVVPSDHDLADWEMLTEAVGGALGKRKIRDTDEQRRTREEMDEDLYKSVTYYERRVIGNELILQEKGILTREEIDRKVAELEARWGAP
jgi:hypothetical protein